MAMGHHEVLGHLWIKRALKAGTLTSGSTINTYNNTGQGLGAAVDQWDGEMYKFQKLVLIVDVASVAGTLTLSIRDDSAPLDNANGDANSNEVVTFKDIDSAGLYYFEMPLDKIWQEGSNRVANDSSGRGVMRYLSLRAVASGGDAVFSALFVFGGNLGSFVEQDGTQLSATYAS